jgi:hypothetical protein
MEAKHMPEPKTQHEAIVYFADPDRCLEFAEKLRTVEADETLLAGR